MPYARTRRYALELVSARRAATTRPWPSNKRLKLARHESNSCNAILRCAVQLNLETLGRLLHLTMTHFEYLAVSFSVVLSFAVVRLLSGISDVFARNRVYWVHASWVIHQLIFIAYVWWIVWSYRDVSWNFFTFLTVLTGVSLVYYQAATLLPASTPSVASWQDHYYIMRRHFFGSLVVWTGVILFNTIYILDVPVSHVSRIGQTVTLLIALVGFFTGRESVHRVLAAAILLLWPVRAALALTPGTLNVP